MLRLTSKLALSNLIKNRKLYYPFALATCLAIAISYIFAKRVLFIKDGILYNQIFRGNKTERQMFQEISDTLTVMASEVEAHA